jgi:LysM repeat protein
LTEAAPPARDRVCPYLGVVDDPATHYAFPSSAQRCHSDGRPFAIDLAKQSKDCLTAQHVTCPRFHPVANRPVGRGALGDAIAVSATAPSLERVEYGTSSVTAPTATLAGGPRLRTTRTRRLAKIVLVAVLAIVAGLGGLQLGSWVAAQSGGSQQTPAPSDASLSAAGLASTTPASSSAVPTGTPSPTSSPQASPGSSLAGTAAGAVEGVTAPPPTHVPQDLVYIVKRGDTLIAIAGRYGVSVEAVKRLNRLKDPNLIFIGQHIRIPRT